MGSPKKVIRTGLELSAFDTQISREPDLADAKAIFFPSGEYFGVWSVCVEEMKGSATAGDSPLFGSSARQMFVSSICREYTRLRPTVISETSSLRGIVCAGI